ncbi:MAG: N-acetylmuramoyl-L-alanine amidase [Syntrophomonas sp.]
MRIGIDPGHGGRDPGAIGPTGLYEKDVTLAISMELNRLLQAAGLETFVVRSDDRTMELVTRTALINNMKCDLAISAHCNSTGSQQANYISTFIQAQGGEAERLAQKVQNELVQATGWPDGGVRVKNLHMTRETRMPAILCECGFISNPGQEEQLRQPEVQKKIAQAIADGVLDYLGITKGDKNMTVDEALEIMVAQGVISSPGYWSKAAECVKYLDALIINMAKKIQGGK